MDFFGIDIFAWFDVSAPLGDVITYVSALAPSAFKIPLLAPLYIKAEGWDGSSSAADKKPEKQDEAPSATGGGRFHADGFNPYLPARNSDDDLILWDDPSPAEEHWPPDNGSEPQQSAHKHLKSSVPTARGAKIVSSTRPAETKGYLLKLRELPLISWPAHEISGYYQWAKDKAQGSGLDVLKQNHSQNGVTDKSKYNVIAIISVLPLEEIIALDPVAVSELADFSDMDMMGWDAHERRLVENAKTNLDSVLPSRIKARAGALSHTDIDDIRSWGRQLEEARLSVFKSLRKESSAEAIAALGQKTKGSVISADLQAVLTAKRPTGLSGVFFSLGLYRNKSGMEIFSTTYRENDTTEFVDYRTFTDEKKRMRAADLIEEMEAQYRGEIKEIERDIPEADSAVALVQLYRNITNVCLRTLQHNRTRLIEEEKAALGAHYQNDDDASILRQGFEKAESLEADIDRRIEHLRLSVVTCDREVLYHLANARLLKTLKDRKSDLVNIKIEALRGQYDQHRLQGKMNALEADAQIIEMLAVLQGEQEAIEEIEILSKQGADPVVLLEHKQYLALPDLREKEPQKIEAEISSPAPGKD